MRSQKPTLTTAEQADAAMKADKGWQGGSASFLSPAAGHVRERVLPGETQQQAKARWAREREVERAYDSDPRRDLGGGRVMPIRYD